MVFFFLLGKFLFLTFLNSLDLMIRYVQWDYQLGKVVGRGTPVKTMAPTQAWISAEQL
jgi:hypothetical protein